MRASIRERPTEETAIQNTKRSGTSHVATCRSDGVTTVKNAASVADAWIGSVKSWLMETP